MEGVGLLLASVPQQQQQRQEQKMAMGKEDNLVPGAPLAAVALVDVPCSRSSGDSIKASGSGSISECQLRHLFQEQRRILSDSLERMPLDQVQRLCEACLACRGALVLTGVGKSGHVARKVAATLSSLGVRAWFLDPTDALHGDIGGVGPDDVIVAFSRSGATEELLRLLPWVRARGAAVAAVTCAAPRGSSPLGKGAAVEVAVPLEKEVCPFGSGPVTSAALQMVVGDTVAVALMQARHLSREQYAANHPAGTIGRRLTLRVSDVMLRGSAALPMCGPDACLADALVELSGKACGCLLVVGPPTATTTGEAAGAGTAAALGQVTAAAAAEGGRANGGGGGAAAEAVQQQQEQQVEQQGACCCSGDAAAAAAASDTASASAARAAAPSMENPHPTLLGIFTDGDLRRALQRHGAALLGMALRDVMTQLPRTCAADIMAADALALMEAGPKVTALPVVAADGRSLLGLVTMHALVSAGLSPPS